MASAQLAPEINVEPGGWHGNDECACIASTLRFYLGSIEGPRDFQMGQADRGPRWNRGDISAGNEQEPGVLTIGADNTGTVRGTTIRPGDAEHPVQAWFFDVTGTYFTAPVYGLEDEIRREALRLLRRHLRNHHR